MRTRRGSSWRTIMPTIPQARCRSSQARRNKRKVLGLLGFGRPSGGRFLVRLLRAVVRSGSGLRGGGIGRRCGGRRHRLGRVAVRVEERHYVGEILRIAQSRKAHLVARRGCFRAVEPRIEAVPVPIATLRCQGIGKGEALTLADWISEHVPKIGTDLVRATLVGVVTGRALVEDLLALGQIRLREENLDRQRGGRSFAAFL